jgi:hypothetical protein
MVHGEIMALLISKCPEILMFPDRSGYRFNDYEEVRRVFAILNDIIAYVFCCVVCINQIQNLPLYPVGPLRWEKL